MSDIVEVEKLDTDLGEIRIGDEVELVNGKRYEVKWLAWHMFCDLIGIQPERLKGAVPPRMIRRIV